MATWTAVVITRRDGTRTLTLHDPRPAWVRRMAEQRAQKGLVAVKATTE